LKTSFKIWLLFIALTSLNACGIYSFNGANVEGKTINIHLIDNKAPLIAPTLSPTLSEKVRNRILNQTNLSQVNSAKTDYDLAGSIISYDVSVSAIQGNTTATENKLTIGVSIIFTNNIDPKKSFTKTFTKFAPFASSRTLQSVETQLINDISSDLADAIFNDAFVNW
jgi:hypothetical protein